MGLCSSTKPEQALRHWELQYLGFRTVGNMYTKTDEGPTHDYLLLKLTMNWTHWNTFYTWCMQYQNMRFLIVAQHSVKLNVDILTDNFSVISSTTHLHFNTCPSSVQNYFNSKWLVTGDRNIKYTIMYTEHVASVPSLRCRSSCGYIKAY
jgi:hypothetical protein